MEPKGVRSFKGEGRRFRFAEALSAVRWPGMEANAMTTKLSPRSTRAPTDVHWSATPVTGGQLRLGEPIALEAYSGRWLRYAKRQPA